MELVITMALVGVLLAIITTLIAGITGIITSEKGAFVEFSDRKVEVTEWFADFDNSNYSYSISDDQSVINAIDVESGECVGQISYTDANDSQSKYFKGYISLVSTAKDLELNKVFGCEYITSLQFEFNDSGNLCKATFISATTDFQFIISIKT